MKEKEKEKEKKKEEEEKPPVRFFTLGRISIVRNTKGNHKGASEGIKQTSETIFKIFQPIYRTISRRFLANKTFSDDLPNSVLAKGDVLATMNFPRKVLSREEKVRPQRSVVLPGSSSSPVYHRANSSDLREFPPARSPPGVKTNSGGVLTSGPSYAQDKG
ncbi:hypothetical protein HZH68_016543 [Vespula germanica]|uniref:Uncharacterized protein n=1 Tax=Vespula germanica TaxID=30212 RepID=A0A834J2P3_VESGE|nr:hypothetical protein HZH68_016543 [Vespula germanica]